MSTKKDQQDEFSGFVANPQALQRGGLAVRALRRQCTAIGITGLIPRWALLERMAQVEVNRFLRAKIAAKKEQSMPLAHRHVHPARHNEEQGIPGFGASPRCKCRRSNAQPGGADASTPFGGGTKKSLFNREVES